MVKFISKIHIKNVEIQKLVDENKSDLNSKLHDFEIELSKKRELFDEEQKGKLVSIEEMDSEIKQKEESRKRACRTY
ncbi:hypothetical protein ZOSMA_11743G00010 [Zostera marina]|uniref:Uncharacterized protein n=1 Tax=Zostera marina TaxID=29655 RepID=A0A0K9Q1Z0_ZOSMR|nr:hypothetical protein ZOSMA_11743G00010 [Zostera marina]